MRLVSLAQVLEVLTKPQEVKASAGGKPTPRKSSSTHLKHLRSHRKQWKFETNIGHLRLPSISGFDLPCLLHAVKLFILSTSCDKVKADNKPWSIVVLFSIFWRYSNKLQPPFSWRFPATAFTGASPEAGLGEWWNNCLDWRFFVVTLISHSSSACISSQFLSRG